MPSPAAAPTQHPTRALPGPVDPRFSAFFEGLARHRVVIRSCTRCATRQWPPRPLCTTCHAMEFEPIEIAAEGDAGTVYTFNVVYRGFDPYFARHVPYAVLVVDLAGFRFMGNLVAPGPAALEELECGTNVRVAFEEDAGRTFLGWTLPHGASR